MDAADQWINLSNKIKDTVSQTWLHIGIRKMPGSFKRYWCLCLNPRASEFIEEGGCGLSFKVYEKLPGRYSVQMNWRIDAVRLVLISFWEKNIDFRHQILYFFLAGCSNLQGLKYWKSYKHSNCKISYNSWWAGKKQF